MEGVPRANIEIPLLPACAFCLQGQQLALPCSPAMTGCFATSPEAREPANQNCAVIYCSSYWVGLSQIFVTIMKS